MDFTSSTARYFYHWLNCVNGNISQRIAKIARLYGEIKYLTEVVPKQYEVFKRIKQEAPNGIVWEDIDNFIKRYEEEHKK